MAWWEGSREEEMVCSETIEDMGGEGCGLRGGQGRARHLNSCRFDVAIVARRVLPSPTVGRAGKIKHIRITHIISANPSNLESIQSIISQPRRSYM